MKEGIYENIIRNSKIAYSKINLNKNKNDKYISVNIIEQSKEFERVLQLTTDNNILDKDISELIINNWISKNFKNDGFDLFVKDIMDKGKSRIEYITDEKEERIIIDIYYLDEYFMLIHNVEHNYNNLSCKQLKTYNWSKDLKGVYISVYEKCDDDSNIKVIDDLIGKRDKDILNKEELLKLKKYEEEVISTRNIKNFFDVITYKDEIKVYMEFTICPLFDYNNNIIGTKGIAVKVSDKASFQNNIEQNEENFREITKYCQSVFIIRDEFRATYVSPGFNNIFGIEPDELYKDINVLKSYFEDEEFNKNFMNCDFNHSKCNEGIGKVRLFNNNEKWVWYKFLPIKDSKGNVIKRMGILNDVTERKKLEEEKNNLKLDFFANLSHEIRTPINLISSTIQLMKMNLNKIELTELDSFNRYIDIMENNTFRLLKLINNLLDSTKIDSGFINFNPINTDIVEFIEDICNSVVEFAEFNDMSLIFDTNIEESNVCFDADIIERTLLNLLSNAVKFNKPNGTIYVDLYIDDKEIKISVKDAGVGIPKANIDKIFKRFEQVNIRGKIEKQGSGIGLYLVKSLIELHGGYITVNSTENEGSEFIVTIPKKVLDIDEDICIINNENRLKKASIEFSDM